MKFDPRENPLRPGDFDLNKQERIAARNARLFEKEKMRLLRQAERSQLRWSGAALVGSLLLLSYFIYHIFGLLR